MFYFVMFNLVLFLGDIISYKIDQSISNVNLDWYAHPETQFGSFRCLWDTIRMRTEMATNLFRDECQRFAIEIYFYFKNRSRAALKVIKFLHGNFIIIKNVRTIAFSNFCVLRSLQLLVFFPVVECI